MRCRKSLVRRNNPRSSKSVVRSTVHMRMFRVGRCEAAYALCACFELVAYNTVRVVHVIFCVFTINTGKHPRN